MRKYFLLILTILASCSVDDSERRNVRFTEYKNSFDSRYMRPSEAMQAGLPKGNILDREFGQYFDSNQDSRLGNLRFSNPYQISGAAYFPQNYVEFEEVGIASWYGIDFHGKQTASGETYDSSEMTAAHRTLPLSSMIRVTNLRNGRVAIVRVNDRGPFSQERVLDVSEKAAEELGFKSDGTTKVYIQLIRDDTDEMIKKLKIKN
jgi:rare lipoprotein A (peptidoglycan hydrolase)